ncbi:hypothetical protein BVY03_03970 [bacterium K02(2017)]|nr:hypothetical protein BVY03_03970 [bacterium K02(2017)]
MIKKTKAFLAEITEVGFLLIALGVVAGILTGDSVPFIGDVVGNITGLVNQLGSNGLVGLMSVGVLAWIFTKK